MHVVTSFRSVQDFLNAEEVPAGIITITENGVPMDFLNNNVGADSTIVFFHGAIEPKHTLPVLSGQGISGGLDANRVFVSDPSLYLASDLWLGWHAGNSKQDVQRLTTQVLGKIISSHAAKRTVFFGGSGGGFASLYYAAQFPGSIALPFNPQTNIRHYQSRAVHAWTQKAFGIHQHEYDPLALVPASIVTDVCALYAKRKKVTIGYMQNLNDTPHVERHMAPFKKLIHKRTTLFSLTDRWDDGHTPPPRDLLTSVLRYVIAEPDPGKALLMAGFARVQ